jgi:hypothetical protein
MCMTPKQLNDFCIANGGKTAIAQLLPCGRTHLTLMCSGKRKITRKTEILVERLQKEIEDKEKNNASGC